MANLKIIVSKQSLIDWHVADAQGNNVAWITKQRMGYLVTLYVEHVAKEHHPRYFETCFADAKACAAKWLNA